MHTVLITQCLQHDFVGPLSPQAALPNALHIGALESERLLGVDPRVGPLAQLIHWARAQDPADLTILHIRDWHDPSDPKQATHLARFGSHCVADTPGASLVLNLDAGVADRNNEHFIDALTLNDFVDTQLMDVLEALPGPLRIGVVGVWTEAKITFLLYELRTRCGVSELATCSALTASASRAQHFNALSQLSKILGVRVLDSVGGFADWLLPEGVEVPLPPAPGGMVPEISGVTLSSEDSSLAGVLYRDAHRLALTPLGGGFSGAAVYRVEAWDTLGHELAGTVLKLGERELIAKERVAFEQVEGILGNDAPSVRGFADLGERAGIKYAFAGMGRGRVRTFKAMYEQGEDVVPVLERVFEGILGRFYGVATYERLPLLDYYTFAPRFADGVEDRVETILGQRGTLTGLRDLPNPAALYRTDLSRLQQATGEYRMVSYIHGDLNGANILLDDRENVWLIDFFHAHRGHVIRDLVKLENDLLYLFTPVTEAQLDEALLLTDALRAVEDLWAPLPEAIGLTVPALIRAWETVRVLRRFMAGLVCEDRDPVQVSIAAMRYAVHTLWFDEASDTSKQWAAFAAGGHTADILAAAERNLRLRVDWVPTESPGRLGLTICPGRADRQRDLGEDLDAIVATGATHLVTLITVPELAWAGVERLGDGAASNGLVHRWDPIVDQGIPDQATMDDLSRWIRAALDRGEDVVVHCMGGLGRSGLVAGCVLVDQGISAEQAIARVRQHRSPRAIETALQEDFVRRFRR